MTVHRADGGEETDVVVLESMAVHSHARDRVEEGRRVSYATRNDLALYMVDDEGRAHTVPGPEDLIRIEELDDPLS